MISKHQQWLKNLRNISIPLTLIFVLGHAYIPEKTLHIYPTAKTVSNLYSDQLAGGNSHGKWLNKAKHHYQCELILSDSPPYCGIAIKTLQDHVQLENGYQISLSDLKAINLNSYHSIRLDLDYTGDSDRFRFSLKNVENSEDLIDFNNEKFTFTYINKSELDDPLLIDLRDFGIAEWWIRQHYEERSDFILHFDNVMEIIFDYDGFSSAGRYDLKINSIEAVGEWVSKEDLYLYIITYWFLLSFAMAVLKIITARKEAEQALDTLKTNFNELKTAAERDPLTGAYSRRGFENIAPSILKNISAQDTYLLMLDIDHFKKINDTYGHDIGDNTLKYFTHCIQNKIRDTDLLVRWGGEEFIIICKQPSIQGAFEFAEKIRNNIAVLTVATEQTSICITVSIGITLIHANEEFPLAFKRADKALYQAKNNGRNQSKVAS